MIDTDKYEGHTEGPWYHHMDDYVEALDLDVPLSVCTLAEGEHKEANAILIQDAPLLLEEVKRLRGETEVNKCPTCGSRDITIYDSFVDSGSHKVRCEGDGCESRWFEIWRHVGIEMIEGEDNR